MSQGQINYTDKSAGGGDPEGNWRAADCNEVKDVVNANATDAESRLLLADTATQPSTADLEVFQISDLDSYIVGDAWEFNADINVIIKADLTFDKAFKNNGFTVNITKTGFAGGNLTYTGVGALFRGTGALLGLVNNNIILTGIGASLFDTDGIQVVLMDGVQVNFNPAGGQSIGTIDNASRAITFNLSTFITYQSGLNILNSVSIGVRQTSFFSNTAGSSAALSIDKNAATISCSNITFALGAAESCIFIDPALVGEADLAILTNTNEFTFYEAGTQGAISAFSDAGGGSTTVTSTAHGLSNLDTVLVEDGFDYYGGYVISNVTANTFDIVKPFTITKTGQWSTGSLTENDSRINAIDVGHEANSKSRATAAFNDNSNVTAITNGAYEDMNLSGITEVAADLSRFFISDGATGEISFQGHRPFNGTLTMMFASANSGVPNADYRVTFQKNSDVPVFATANYMPLSLKGEGDQVSLTFSLTLQPGDTFKPKIAGDGTSVNFTVAHGIISAM